MPIEAKIIADSIAPNGKRLTTMVIRYPRFIHSELLTHRMFSRNAASSRAIPVKKMLEQVKTDPAMPTWWGKNEPGMKAREELTGESLDRAKTAWLAARDSAVDWVSRLNDLGLHKQIANRILEPWMWMVTIVSATEWGNFYNLRCHPDAQPEMRALAEEMLRAHNESTPILKTENEWHLPFITDDERKTLTHDQQLRVSVARCARVSYLNHEGKVDHNKDYQLHDALIKAPHASPFEHQAIPLSQAKLSCGNYLGWAAYRFVVANENRPKFYRLKVPKKEST